MAPETALFEQHQIRRVHDESTGTWWFSVVDILQVLIQQPDYQAARNYWKVLKSRLAKEGSQVVTNCNRLKLAASDGKQYLTDVATAETLLRLVQSVPSPKAEPIKLWLAEVGHERMQELADPALALDRARELWKSHGCSENGSSTAWPARRPGTSSPTTGPTTISRRARSSPSSPTSSTRSGPGVSDSLPLCGSGRVGWVGALHGRPRCQGRAAAQRRHGSGEGEPDGALELQAATAIAQPLRLVPAQTKPMSHPRGET